jgi:hypothetical protein
MKEKPIRLRKGRCGVMRSVGGPMYLADTMEEAEAMAEAAEGPIEKGPTVDATTVTSVDRENKVINFGSIERNPNDPWVKKRNTEESA